MYILNIYFWIIDNDYNKIMKKYIRNWSYDHLGNVKILSETMLDFDTLAEYIKKVMRIGKRYNIKISHVHELPYEIYKEIYKVDFTIESSKRGD